MYLKVPSASSTGTITFTGYSQNTNRYIKTKSDSTNTIGTISFSASDIVTVDGDTYLQLTSVSDFKFATVSITLTSDEVYATLTKLTTPTITISDDGTVTITTTDADATIYYTTDGTTPSSSSTAYTGTFTVEDGTTVTAVAIGDETLYENSDIASSQYVDPNGEVYAPTIAVYNGTAVISTETVNPTILYSTDGTNYSEYTHPVTFLEDGTIYAKVTRDSTTYSDVVEQAVTAVAATDGSKTKVIGYDSSWTDMTNGKNYGKESDGWQVWISANSSGTYDKALSWGSSITVDGTTYNSLKGSNGRQFNITLPDTVIANRITIYGYNNGTPSTTSLWSTVGSTTYDESTEAPLVSTDASDPYVRVFSLDNVTGNIALINNGAIQQCFVVVIDYTTCVDVTVDQTIGYATLYSDDELTIPDNTQAYTGTLSGDNLVLTELTGGVVPAKTAVVVTGDGGTFYASNTGAATVEEDLQGTSTDIATSSITGGTVCVLGYENSEVGFYQYTGTTLAANKAYLVVPESTSAKGISIVFNDGSTTGINAVDASETAENEVKYNLAGQRVSDNAKGIIIVKGKKYIVK